ncbi:putative GTP-binding protein [Rutstroemia sp. NJR-2017a BBW]|nr:putative GTP-binding protein [Rutstroemia sp. NJR-2017a BBW]
MKITFQTPPKNLDQKMIYNILRDYKILNCEVLIRDENITVDDFIDVIMKEHRKYIKCLYRVAGLPGQAGAGAQHGRYVVRDGFEVLIRDENITVDDFIDVIMKEHRKYIKCLYRVAGLPGQAGAGAQHGRYVVRDGFGD